MLDQRRVEDLAGEGRRRHEESRSAAGIDADDVARADRDPRRVRRGPSGDALRIARAHRRVGGRPRDRPQTAQRHGRRRRCRSHAPAHYDAVEWRNANRGVSGAGHSERGAAGGAHRCGRRLGQVRADRGGGMRRPRPGRALRGPWRAPARRAHRQPTPSTRTKSAVLASRADRSRAPGRRRCGTRRGACSIEGNSMHDRPAGVPRALDALGLAAADDEPALVGLERAEGAGAVVGVAVLVVDVHPDDRVALSA